MHFLQILSFLLFLVILHRSTAGIAEGIIDYLLKFFVLMLACIIPTGFVLSIFSALNISWAWFFLITIFAGLILLQTSHRVFTPFDFKKFSWIGWMQQLNLVEKITFSILTLAVIITATANLIIIFNTYPSEWDSMTGHLVKCAFYLQNGNFNRIGGTTWTIDFYPNSLPSIQLFFYHLIGSESGFKVIHYIAYWVFGFAMFGITRQLTLSVSAAVYVGLISLLLPTALVQATTTETDLILTAYLATLFYFILRFQKTTNQRTALIFIALSAAIWMSHKVTFILITPSVLVVAIYFLLIKKGFWKHWKLFFGAFILFFAMYVLPTGYLGNIKETGKLGGISAPEEVMRWHSNLNYSGKEIAKFGTMNVARYALDFFNLDGLRNFTFGEKINDFIRILPEKFARKVNLERLDYWVVAPFKLDPTVPFYIERPYWGIISFLMILPAILLVFLRRKLHQKELIYLLIAGILHCLSLCYTAPYDPIKGRYFMNTAVWFLPFIVVFFNGKSRSFFLLFCSIIIVFQAFGTVFQRNLYPMFSSKVHPKSIFQMSRLEQQVSVSRPDIFAAYAKFDSLVPQNAIVALATTNEDFEYPLFGEKLSRKLIPIHPFKATMKPIPANADFVFITAGVLPIEKGDILLNNQDFDIKNINPIEASKYYLRKIKK